jgi:hypothetical protein
MLYMRWFGAPAKGGEDWRETTAIHTVHPITTIARIFSLEFANSAEVMKVESQTQRQNRKGFKERVDGQNHAKRKF